MKLVAIPSQVDYSVKLSKAQYDRLNKLYFIEDGVYEMFAEVGVDSRTIEFNGHFGSYFYFSLSTDLEIQPVLDVLEKLVSPRKRIPKAV